MAQYLKRTSLAFVYLLVFSSLLSPRLGLAGSGFHYLESDSVDPSFVPAPPASGSDEDTKDLDGVRFYQNHRTTSECDRATREAQAGFGALFGPSHSLLSPAEVAKLRPLFEEILDDSEYFIRKVKNRWARPRPFVRDSRIILCVPTTGGFSYPSGHAVIAQAVAKTLVLIFPERREALLERAREIGRGRVLGGVHHPLDIEAGFLLGDEIFDALNRSSKFHNRIRQLTAPASKSRH